MLTISEFPLLYEAVFTQPAIDNHAHPLLRTEKRHFLPFEGLISEAEGPALVEDARYTLACFRATKHLAQLYGLDQKNTTWENVKSHRAGVDYRELCSMCFKNSGIKHILIDDGLDASKTLAEDYKWHDQFINGSTRRIVRIEVEAETILLTLVRMLAWPDVNFEELLTEFERQLRSKLTESMADEDVVGLKSIVCYRSGMNISVKGSTKEKESALRSISEAFKASGKIRIAHKALNDEIVRTALEIAGQHGKPVQFHTGLGDNDLNLLLSSPAHMQQIIKAYPNTIFVLLHSSYPYTREAGYLTSVYKNVYLDFGEVFPMVSGEGQRNIIREVLELCPTNKIMWSSDGHWWPESYYLGLLQAREALYHILSDSVRRGELREDEAVEIVEKALYSNAAKLYRFEQ